MAAFEGAGTTVAFAGAPVGLTAEIIDIAGGEMTREVINVTTYADTGGEVFIPARNHDPGEYQCQILFDPSVDVSALMALPKAALTITHSDAGAAAWVVDAILANFGHVSPYQDRALATITFKLSGAIAVTP